MGALTGLSVAEVEFATEDAADAFEPPAWFGREVTDDLGSRSATGLRGAAADAGE